MDVDAIRRGEILV